jgi:flagellar protein FlgJ
MAVSDMAAQGLAGAVGRGNAALRGGLAVDPAGLAELRSAAGRDDPEALLAAARQFEALLVGKMLESMRATVPENPLTGGRDVATFQSMLDTEMAQELVAGRGFGLAEALVRELGGGAPTAAPGAGDAPAAAPGLARYRAVAGEGAAQRG